MNDYMREFHASLLRLANKVGPELLSIAINVDPCAGHVAYTSSQGIWVSEKVATTEPHNVEVYVAHEILHHVVGDPEQTSRFPMFIVNLAEDYRINQLLQELFGYDVRKVAFPGLRDKKYDKMTIRQICEALTKAGVSSYNHYQQRIATKEILATVQAIRRRYNLPRRAPYFHMDGIDQAAFVNSIAPTLQAKMRVDTLRNVNLGMALEGMWAHLFLPAAVHSLPTPTKKLALQPSAALTYCMDGEWYREHTVGDAVKSAITATAVLNVMDIDGAWIDHRINLAKARIERLGEELEFRAAARTRRRKRKYLRHVNTRGVRERLANTLLRLDRLKAMKPLSTLLENHKVRIQPGKRVRMPSLHTAQLELEQGTVTLPNVVGSELSRRIQRVSRRADGQIEEYLEASQQVKRHLGNLFGKTKDERRRDPLEDKQEGQPDPAQAGKIPKADVGPAKQGKPGEGQGGKGEGQGKGAEKDKKSKGSGGTGKASGDSGDPDTGDADTGEGMEEGESDGGSPGGEGHGTETGSLTNTRLEEEQLIFANAGRLLYIIKMMKEIESKLSAMPKRRVDENTSIPLGISYGNDLENVEASEFAMLSNPVTAMDFYVRLSQGALMQRQPIERRQAAVVICIDTSGSMWGGRLEKAIAFALAFANRLAMYNRGFAIILFDTQAYAHLVIEGRPTLKQLLDLFKRVRSGGTEFQPPIERAFEIRDQYKWKETVVILVTDGESSFREPERIKQLKGRKDSLQAVLIGNSKFHGDATEELFDEIYKTTRKGALLTLLKVAKSII